MRALAEVKRMAKVHKQEALAQIRTLLALERNYLAEERTALAEFRTGLALTVIGPTASTVIAYIFSALPLAQTILLDVLNVAFFAILTIIGIRTSLTSRTKLKTIRKREKIIKDREKAIIDSSKELHDLLCDCLDLEEENK